MNHPLQEELLGYVLGALDATEERDIQLKIEQDPSLQDQVEQIRENLMPLEALETPTGMRPGMARRTCEWVAGVDKDPGLAEFHQIEDTNHIEALVSREVSADKVASVRDQDHVDATGVHAASIVSAHAAKDSDVESSQVAQHAQIFESEHASAFSEDPKFQWLHPRTWSMTDAMAGVAILAVMGGILFPAISYQRYNSRMLSCQENMHQIGHALMQYSDINGGNFVEIPTEGQLSASGYFAPALMDAGLIEEDRVFSCAGLGETTPVHIPSIAQINSATGSQLDHLRHTMSGNYGYSMGYQKEDHYQPLANRGLTNTVLVADMPSLNQPGRRSVNHGSWGQNCLFGDGNVKFIRGDSVGEDAIFENDYGVVAPGTSEYDSVIAPSHLSPVKW